MNIVVLFEVKRVERSYVVDEEIGEGWVKSHMDKLNSECDERKAWFLWVIRNSRNKE